MRQRSRVRMRPTFVRNSKCSLFLRVTERVCVPSRRAGRSPSSRGGSGAGACGASLIRGDPAGRACAAARAGRRKFACNAGITPAGRRPAVALSEPGIPFPHARRPRPGVRHIGSNARGRPRVNGVAGRAHGRHPDPSGGSARYSSHALIAQAGASVEPAGLRGSGRGRGVSRVLLL